MVRIEATFSRSADCRAIDAHIRTASSEQPGSDGIQISKRGETPITIQDLEKVIQVHISRRIEPKELKMVLNEPAVTVTMVDGRLKADHENRVELALEAWNTQPIIDGDDGVCIRTLDGDGAVYGVATSPDGEIFTTSGHHDLPRGRQRGGAFRQWDSATGQCTLDIEHDDKMLCIAVSPDGSTIAYGSHDNIIHLWDATGRVKKKLIGHTDAMCRLAFSNDGCTLVSGSYDDSIEVWDVDTGTSRLKLTEHGNIVYGVAISPDGSAIYSASEDRTIKKWSSDTGECVRTMNHDQPVHSIAVSPDGAIIAFGSKCGTIHFWDSENGQRAQTLDRHFAIVWSLDFSPDGRTLVSGSADGTIKQWDVATGALIRTFSGHEMVVWAVAFSRDGTTIVSGSDDRTAKVWSTLPRTPQFLATVNQLCSSPVAPDADITIDPGDSVALPCDLARILLHFLATGLPRSFTMTLTRPVARVELDENNFIKTDSEDAELVTSIKLFNADRCDQIIADYFLSAASDVFLIDATVDQLRQVVTHVASHAVPSSLTVTTADPATTVTLTDGLFSADRHALEVDAILSEANCHMLLRAIAEQEQNMAMLRAELTTVKTESTAQISMLSAELADLKATLASFCASPQTCPFTEANRASGISYLKATPCSRPPSRPTMALATSRRPLVSSADSAMPDASQRPESPSTRRSSPRPGPGSRRSK
ncbi:Protein kinase domain [Carpediemonas membranifera]|uniref:Protein kinase domain n=1 Tax=Carpediemonas membranifera TaxID=201153 RepID=A0A8J6AYZ6_9EUKA|nr:Protein kinase domain [Carpediemonas membranifera]|eukprot:KAG9395810.1 Protein kinase domain [Carpediemonas membranifera]